MQANTFVTVTARSHLLVEDSLLPPFVSGIIYYIIHIVSTFNLMTKAAYYKKSILFLQRTCNFIKSSPVQFDTVAIILLCGLDFQCDLSNIQTRQCFSCFKI